MFFISKIQENYFLFIILQKNVLEKVLPKKFKK